MNIYTVYIHEGMDVCILHRRPLAQFLKLAAVMSAVRLVSATCPGSPWEEWRGHCYRLTHQKTPWHGVRGECKTFFRSADAASASSKAENDFIKSGFHDNLLILINASFY